MITAGQARNYENEIKKFLNEYLGDELCARQIWYEALEGCGVPDPQDMDFLHQVLDGLDGWKCVGDQRYEKYGIQKSYKRHAKQEDGFDRDGRIRVQHLFHVGGLYQAPDGKVYKVVLSEVYNLRCFEMKDGKMVGPMVRIHPTSELARSLVTYKG